MKVFEQYANFYDSFYIDKDYESEANFVLSLAKRHGFTNPRTLLDIGCGTGGHLIPFAKKGITVKGFDLSNKMIGYAKEKIIETKIEDMADVEVADAISYRDGKKYDLVVSMFAVMGYLTSNDDFLAGLKTAREHLSKNGLFIFDVWSGMTVLTQKPETRIQEFMKDGLRTLRLVKPKLVPAKQTVSISYNIIQICEQKIVRETAETHQMRYFFIQELDLFLKYTGFELIRVYPFMDMKRELEIGDWNISIVAKAK